MIKKTTNNYFPWSGRYKITVLNAKTRELIQEDDIDNLVTDDALQELKKAFEDGSNDMDIKYIALGTGTTAVSASDSTLDNEQARFYKTNQFDDGIGSIKTIFFVLDNEAKFEIEEIGLFGGSGASLVLDSGLMISRILWNFDKTVDDVEIQFSRFDTLGRG